MDTIWERIKDASLRSRLAWGYAIVFTILFAVGFISVYLVSEKYRKQEFFQRLKDRTLTTYKLMVEVDQIDVKTLSLFDKNTINSLYDEKVLLFDSSFRMIYSSLDDTQIDYPLELLNRLKEGQNEIRLDEEKYEILGIRFRYGSHTYYGITKAYDRFGKRKMTFLGISLLCTFAVVFVLLVVLSRYLAKIITYPITRLTKDIDSISTDRLSVRIDEHSARDEVGLLTNKFNELLDKVENAFKFQYHFIHHISHELKTPLAVMVANAEAALAEEKKETLTSSLYFLRHSLMEMSHVINAMLDISKTESRLADVRSESIRLDELLFECIDELSYLQTGAEFNFKIDGSIEESDRLTIKGNSRMLKMAFMNLLRNALSYSEVEIPVVEIRSGEETITMIFSNDGIPIQEGEVQKLFTHMFRGGNSEGKKGFGLGLVLVHRIIRLHSGTINYELLGDQRNSFRISFPIP